MVIKLFPNVQQQQFITTATGYITSLWFHPQISLGYSRRVALTIITKIKKRQKNNCNYTHTCYVRVRTSEIHHLSFFIVTHGALDIVYPNSMQDAYYNEPRALFHFSELAGRRELVLIALKGKPKGWFA